MQWLVFLQWLTSRLDWRFHLAVALDFGFFGLTQLSLLSSAMWLVSLGYVQQACPCLHPPYWYQPWLLLAGRRERESSPWTERPISIGRPEINSKELEACRRYWRNAFSYSCQRNWKRVPIQSSEASGFYDARWLEITSCRRCHPLHSNVVASHGLAVELTSDLQVARRRLLLAFSLRKLLPATGVIWALRAQSWKKSWKMSSQNRPRGKKSKTESKKPKLTVFQLFWLFFNSVFGSLGPGPRTHFPTLFPTLGPEGPNDPFSRARESPNIQPSAQLTILTSDFGLPSQTSPPTLQRKYPPPPLYSNSASLFWLARRLCVGWVIS